MPAMRAFALSRVGGLVVCGLLAPHGSLSLAQEFRVETEVFVGEEPEPASRAITLFEKSAVYHFAERPAQIAIYRRTPGQAESQFTVLDVDKKRRTDISVPRMEKLIVKLSEWSAKQESEIIRFSGSPTFDESFDEETGAVTLAHKLWTYHAATIKAEQPEALLRYREFTDHYARLTCLLWNAPPPGPRLALNEALAKRGLVPVEIRRIVEGEEEEVRTVHLFYWRISRDDQERLDDAREKIASYAKVSNEAFRGE